MRLVVAASAVSLLAASCGARVEVNDTGVDSPTTETTSDGSTLNGPDNADVSPSSKMIGDVANPCGPGKASGGGASTGVTGNQITIGVISDRENAQVALPTVGIEEGVKAFVQFCNEAGGINGRKIVLKTYDSMLTNIDQVTKQACADDLLSLVGDGSVLDQNGISSREGCGLPEIAAYAATTTRSGSKNFFAPVPSLNPTEISSGQCRWIAEKYPEAVKASAMAYAALPPSEVRGKQVMDSCVGQGGFKWVAELPVPFGEKNLTSYASRFKSSGAKYFSMVSTTAETLALLRELKVQDASPEVIDLGQQYYDPAFAKDPLADGAYVVAQTVPFREASTSAALRLYQEYVKKVKGVESTLGVEAFSAAMLFAVAAKAAGGNLTRDSLVSEVKKITSWTGGGLQCKTNPGQGKTNDCFVLLQVKDKDFVRVFPKKGFDQSPDNVHRSTKRFEPPAG